MAGRGSADRSTIPPALIKALPTCYGAVSAVSMRVCVVLLLAVSVVALANGDVPQFRPVRAAEPHRAHGGYSPRGQRGGYGRQGGHGYGGGKSGSHSHHNGNERGGNFHKPSHNAYPSQGHGGSSSGSHAQAQSSSSSIGFKSPLGSFSVSQSQASSSANAG